MSSNRQRDGCSPRRRTNGRKVCTCQLIRRDSGLSATRRVLGDEIDGEGRESIDGRLFVALDSPIRILDPTNGRIGGRGKERRVNVALAFVQVRGGAECERNESERREKNGRVWQRESSGEVEEICTACRADTLRRSTPVFFVGGEKE